MVEAAARVATGAVTTASRDVQLNGRAVGVGQYVGLLEDEPVAGGAEFEPVARAIIDRLLAEPREVVTLLTGEEEPDLSRLLAELEQSNPELEIEVHEGGQPHYPLLVSAEYQQARSLHSTSDAADSRHPCVGISVLPRRSGARARVSLLDRDTRL